MEDQKPGSELERFYHQLLSPLSLFPRRATPPEPQKHRPEAVLRWQTISLAKLRVGPLCNQVAKLLASSGLTARVSPKERLRLTEVILNELKCSWREPPAEPSLSYGNNVKLRKRLETYVLLSSEQLFLRYLHLLVTMSTSRGVFTESAILTRLAASLARDCTVFLTSPKVYRCLLKDFQALLKIEQAHGNVGKLRPVCPPGTFKFCPIPWPHSTGFGEVPCSSLNLNYLIQLSRPPEFFREPELDPVKELKSIPQLKSKRHLHWLPSIRKEREIDLGSSEMVSLPSHSVTPTSAASPPSFPLSSRLQRAQSMPSLREGWMLADELGLPPLSTRPLTPLVLAPESKPELTRDIVAEDLKQKIKNMNWEWTHYSPLDSGLPRLLGAVTCRPAAAHRMVELQKMLKRFQEEEVSGQWDLQLPKSPPFQPQPVTFTLKLRNQVVVQAAAVQLSDRNFLDSFHVEGAGVLYNHLAGELDSKAIEEMDVDYYVANSIKEVYKELMSCVSTNHLCFDQEPLVEAAAEKDWSTFLSSAFLRQEKQFQIINPDLVGLYSQKTNTLESNTEKVASFTSPQATKAWEKRSNKASWRSWWKSTLSMEDYFKHLTNQETDFLHVIFRIYEEDVPVEAPPPVKETLEIQRPPPLIEDEEPDFVPGEWDWNTVLQHRLLAGSPNILSLQKRLEQLWSMLEVPNKARLDMAIKYSSNARLQQLPSLVKAWEQAMKSIQLREILLGRLEGFEQQASNPNRFFQKTDLDLSHLLEQDQFRSYVHKQLSRMEPSLISLLEEIELIFGEPVTFKGRRYLDKMKRDKVEMLYWLQQHRRIQNLIRTQKTSLQSTLSRNNSSRPLIAPENSPTSL
ncbi:PREDICTED: coiled-coil domain-containing protein 87 [Chinchilla lanigera]|uniref:coiled-coil domain-containing protein 87 n=1 Tax=Chinchilla lanigera TaxID=34839 RepID=UPI00038EF8EB|nr:PREDICTED: coiled-coil domain-containing protein 87 [Chinchilla lanigera]